MWSTASCSTATARWCFVETRNEWIAARNEWRVTRNEWEPAVALLVSLSSLLVTSLNDSDAGRVQRGAGRGIAVGADRAGEVPQEAHVEAGGTGILGGPQH